MCCLVLFVVCAGCCLLGLRLGCFGVVVGVCFRRLLSLLLTLRFRFWHIGGFGDLWFVTLVVFLFGFAGFGLGRWGGGVFV